MAEAASETAAPGARSYTAAEAVARTGADDRSAMVSAIFVMLAVLLLAVPVPFGGYLPWAWSLHAILAGLLTGFTGVALFVGGSIDATAVRRIAAPVVLYTGVVVWAGVQWMPGDVFGLGSEWWTRAATVLGRELDGRITVNPGETLTGVMRLATYGAVFLVAFLLGQRTRYARSVLAVVAMAIVVYAIYGLVNHPQIGGKAGIAFALETDARFNFGGVFGNRNTFATYLGLGLICVLALLFRDAGAIFETSRNWRRRTSMAIEVLCGRRAHLTVATLVLVTALLLTASRAGIASTAIAAAALLIAAVQARRASVGAALVVAAIGLSVAVAAFSVGGERFMERAARTLGEPGVGAPVSLGERMVVYELTLDGIREYPLTGTGLGTFSDTFPHFRDETLRTQKHYALAHSSYLENLLELGVPAATALFLAVALLGWTCWRGLARRRRGIEFPMIGVAATVLVGLHSLVDFSLQVPAVAISYAALMGVCTAQSFGQRERGGRPDTDTPGAPT